MKVLYDKIKWNICSKTLLILFKLKMFFQIEQRVGFKYFYIFSFRKLLLINIQNKKILSNVIRPKLFSHWLYDKSV